MGIFDNLFDLNGDGKLDSFEKATEFSFLMEMMENEENKKEDEENGIYDPNLDEIFDD